LVADKDRAIGIVLGGLKGHVTVNGEGFDSIMPSQAHLPDQDIANVLTYVRSAWGNKGDAVTREEVTRKRSAGTPVITASR
jgi:nitrite reductase (NO-forming)